MKTAERLITSHIERLIRDEWSCGYKWHIVQLDRDRNAEKLFPFGVSAFSAEAMALFEKIGGENLVKIEDHYVVVRFL